MARYRRIDPYIWHDDKFPSFSDDAKLLFFHLLTTPRGNPLGCFVQGKADMAEYLGWSSKRLETPFRVLVSSDRIRYDEKTRLILIPRYLFYNPLENENQAKMACKYLSELPYNAQHFQGLKQSLEQYGKPFLILLVNALADRINSGNGIGNGIGNGTPNTEPYPFLSEPQHLTVPPISPKGDDTPLPPVWGSPQDLVDLYNSETPDELPAVSKLSPGRISKAKFYLKAFPDREFWFGVCKQIHRSAFLRGLKPTTNGGTFRADFDWLLTKGKDGSENCVKVYEGRYTDERRQ